MIAPPSAVPVDISATTHGARIIDDEQPRPSKTVRDSHDIYLPNYFESVSHIAVDIGGSLAKVVYFSHSAQGVRSPRIAPQDVQQPVPNGTLNPTALHRQAAESVPALPHFDPRKLRRRSLPEHFPGGRLNFVKFETGDIASCVRFLRELIEKSARSNKVEMNEMRRSVKLMTTGGGAHLFYDLFERELGVEVHKEEEMQCLITGLNFMTLIPDEVFWYSDVLVDELYLAQNSLTSKTIPHGDSRMESTMQKDLPRPSPHPPLFAPMFESEPSPKLPCLLVNIGSGVSILKVDENGQFERVSGTSLGGGTLWGLLGLLTDARNFDEMLELCERGNNSNVDMLVGDIYGPVGLDHLGLKASTIASSFGKVFRWDRQGELGASSGPSEPSARRRMRFSQEDICRSLLYAISNNIGQIAHLNAEKYKLDRVYFGGCFIRGHQATISTLSYAIRFWSQGRRRAYFLRHEGYLGAVGAWVRHLGIDSKQAEAQAQSPCTPPGINPELADALGSVALDDAPHDGTTTTPSPTNTEGARTGSADASGSACTSPPSAERLLRELEALDSEHLGEGPTSVAKVMEQLNTAHVMADAIETRVNSLLGKLQELVPEAK